MRTTATFVPTAEAAFIAGLTDRDMNRVIDEHIVPDALVRVDKGRVFVRLAAAFARFYFGTEDQFVAGLRRKILSDLTHRLEQRADRVVVFDLLHMPKGIDWRVSVPFAQIDVTSFIQEALERARQVERAHALVHVDPELMGGVPVFCGTRVVIDVVTASLERGVGQARLSASYPFLTDEHIAAARIYAKVHPRRGRPKRLADVHPNWTVKSSRVVRPAKA